MCPAPARSPEPEWGGVGCKRARVSVQGLALRDMGGPAPRHLMERKQCMVNTQDSLMEAGQGPVEARALFHSARLQGLPVNPQWG